MSRPRAADPPRRILLVDDEPGLLHAMQLYLEMDGFVVFTARDGIEALDAVRERLPDLIVLDAMMPRLDGFATLRRLREFSNVPVIMLTVRGEEADRVRGLSLGADDYVTKPFSQRELRARILAVLRRAESPPHVPQTRLVIDDDLAIDFSRNEVHRQGKVIKLTPIEHRLLYHLVSHPGQVLTHESLLMRVWGHEYREEEHYVRLYINYLRQKIEPDPARPRYILTERGLGYRFVDYRSPRTPAPKPVRSRADV